MDFLMQEIGLEAELQLGTSVPISSKATTAELPAPPSTGHISVQTPTASTPLKTAVSPASAPGTGTGTSDQLDSVLQKASARKSSSRIRLPALSQEATSSPRISARFPARDGYAASARDGYASSARSVLAGPVDQLLPDGFVASGDLEEDAQRLMDMESEV